MTNKDTNTKEGKSVWPPLIPQSEGLATDQLDQTKSSERHDLLDMIIGFLIPSAAFVLTSIRAVVALGKFVSPGIRPEVAFAVVLSIVFLLCGIPPWRLGLGRPIPHRRRVAKAAWIGLLIGIGAKVVLGFEAYVSHTTAHPWAP